MIIVFIGGDGSGKSTVASYFYDFFKRLGLKVEYCRPFERYFVLGFFLGLFKKRHKKIADNFLTKKRDQHSRLFTLWPFLVFFDQFLLFLFIKIFKKDKIVISDRFAYDYIVSWKYYGCSSRLTEWLYYHFPRPDIAFVLDVSPKKAFERKIRKGDTYRNDYSFFEFHILEHRTVAQKLGLKVVSTDCSLKDTASVIRKDLREFFISKLPQEDRLLLLFSNPHFKVGDVNNWTTSFKSLDWEYVVDMAVKNSVEDVFATNLYNYFDEKQLALPSTVIYLIKRCRERKELFWKTTKSVCERLDKSGVDYVTFKTIPSFDYLPSDIDILVRSRQKKKASRILSSIYSSSSPEFMHDSLSFRGRTLIPSDLHEKISWSSSRCVDEKSVLRRKRTVNIKGISLNLPSREDELLVLLGHSIFQHHYTALGEFYFIIDLMRKKLDLPYLEDQFSKSGTRDEFLALMKASIARYTMFFDCNYKSEILDIAPEIDSGMSLESLLGWPIFFHPFGWVRKSSFLQILDLALTVMRRIRFGLIKKLPFNSNWLTNSSCQ